MAGGGIAQRWRELSGENNWEGLLDPLDIDLCRYIIHYSERIEAVANAYNGRRCQICADSSNIHQTISSPRSEIKLGNWLIAGESSRMGYVVVATIEGKAVLGRRDILICWRGTMTVLEKINDVVALTDSVSDIFGDYSYQDAKVHMGFHSIYSAKSPSSGARSPSSEYNKTSAREQVNLN
ncbi:hypothetical protein Dsin_021041 [Dipteronia sinensis]|uniref:Phospholipase A1 n=1 Tax=Dipteronia sinensis TaxID=43782 RepID=A0AAE0E482_9ROSI|nr:hypothetical protein Dsin_021041 [Dipteronia sinensis]